jgi:hypothetical protein
MPVAAKLSQVYETFGDDVVNELVEWLNHVDATYRLELRELTLIRKYFGSAFVS